MEQERIMRFAGMFELLGQSWQIYKKRFAVFLEILIIPFLLLFVPDFLLPKVGPDNLFGAIALLTGLVIFMGFLGVFIHLATLSVIQDNTLFAGQALKKAGKRFLSFLWVSAIRNILVLLGFIFFIVPGIIFSLWFALTSFVFVDEDKRGWNALKRSRELMSHMWTPVFWRFFVAGLLALPLYILSGLTELLSPELILLGTAVNFAIGLLSYPFFLIFGFQVYRQVKSIKEAGGVVREGVWKVVVLVLLVVLVIFGILAGIALVSLDGARVEARDARLQSQVQYVRTALDLYYDQNGSYPSSLQEVSFLEGINPEVLSALEYHAVEGGSSYSLCADFEEQEDQCFSFQGY